MLFNRLGNNDVSRKVAQEASCLKPKVFETTLSVVRAALFADAEKSAQTASSRKASNELSYRALVKRFRWQNGDFLVDCMEDVERALAESRELKGRLCPPNKAVTLVVFCWTCVVVKVCLRRHTCLPVG